MSLPAVKKWHHSGPFVARWTHGEIYSAVGTLSSDFHRQTVNTNWWIPNCTPTQRRKATAADILFSHSLPRVWQMVQWWGNKLFCPNFPSCPMGIKFNFAPKLCSGNREENKHGISVQRWIGNSLERVWWRWPGTDWLECLPSPAASWLQPNVKALSHNGHPVFQDTPQTLINFFFFSWCRAAYLQCQLTPHIWIQEVFNSTQIQSAFSNVPSYYW